MPVQVFFFNSLCEAPKSVAAHRSGAERARAPAAVAMKRTTGMGGGGGDMGARDMSYTNLAGAAPNSDSSLSASLCLSLCVCVRCALCCGCGARHCGSPSPLSHHLSHLCALTPPQLSRSFPLLPCKPLHWRLRSLCTGACAASALALAQPVHRRLRSLRTGTCATSHPQRASLASHTH